jgi:hypothetical protein
MQELMMAGHAASASSARQPGSFDQLTGWNATVGAAGTSGRLVGTQAASSAMAASAAARLKKITTTEICPDQSLMPA